jgi:hypothetical protein
MSRFPGFGKNDASVKGVPAREGRGSSGRFPGFNPSNRIHATSFRHIPAYPYYVAMQQLQGPRPFGRLDGLRDRNFTHLLPKA